MPKNSERYLTVLNLKYMVLCCLLTSSFGNLSANNSEIDQFKEEICSAGKGTEQGLNFVELMQVDLNADGVEETVALHQGNNFASYYVFIKSTCGYKPVKDSTDSAFSFLQYTSSSSCYPIGCLTSTSCIEGKNGRAVQLREVRNTLDAQSRILWFEGRLPDDKITGEMSITTYTLTDDVMETVDNEVQNISADWNPSLHFTPPTFDRISCQ